MTRQYSTTVGYLNEKHLTKEPSTTKNGSPCDLISGSIAIKVDDVILYHQVYVKSKTNKGEANPMYESIDTMYNQYHSIKEVKENKASEASYILVKGTPVSKDYQDKTGVVQECQFGCNVGAVERVDPNKNKPKIKMTLTGYIKSIIDEFENGEETGRKIIELVGIDYYGNAEIYKIYVEEEYAEAICDAWSVGDTVQPICTIINHITSKVSNRKSIIGVETSVSYERRLSLVNAFPAIEDEDKQIDATEIRNALEARNLKLESLRTNKAQPTAASKPVNVVIDDDEDCPF